MKVELQHARLLNAAQAIRRLAEAIDAEVRAANAASPIALPSLSGLPAKATWLHEQLPMLRELSVVALLLDADGDGTTTVTVPDTGWDPSTMLETVADQTFGPGFVEATGLEGDELHALLLTLGSVGRELPPGSAMTATELRQFIIDHPEVATALQNTRPSGSGPAGTLLGLTQPFMTSPGGAGAVLDQRKLDARDLFAGLSPDQAAILAMTYPSLVGNMSGVPFANRAHANTVNVVAALAAERSELAGLRDQHEENQGDWDFLGRNNDDLEGPIGDLEDRIALYESILDDKRTIVYFDPAGDGAIAEMHGTIDSRTNNVGVLVPGTGTDLSNYEGGVARRSRQFAANDPTGGLTMISWMGGDLPDGVVSDAPFANYSKDLGPRLAEFSRDLDLEIQRSSASDPEVAVAGHSYGGAVVGRSELAGLVADRVLHIESAGMGHDVHEPGDLPASQRNVDRYSMTAPDDPISLSQGTQAGDNIGHGADPDTFDGTTRLHTGDTVDGEPNTGLDAHTRVFQEHSDAWENMYEVFTGGVVETYRSPNYEYIQTYQGPPVVIQDGWRDDGERIDIE
ncbi:hypothetical protein AFL01nite_28100 [Aeromicrobium flavum]|uniref:DUF1023 domain-containing protein n=1 Tax=Aeromicrobium flavum TaxID=416568 RepID=A0A512HYF1_9ACTN|nr:alpha/beta hydrolase [Aeromicrobium flavum]GEO90483.1 hypothetical protein AFL01nite_28100 [Aeromicrobium flavum]